jgi:hypothetical protein
VKREHNGAINIWIEISEGFDSALDVKDGCEITKYSKINTFTGVFKL